MNYQVKTISGNVGFEDTLNSVFDELEQIGLSGVPGEPKVQILLSATGKFTPDEGEGPKAYVDATIFVGATAEDIATEIAPNLLSSALTSKTPTSPITTGFHSK